jgi:membrane fusion protein (multidrug efflux system)
MRILAPLLVVCLGLVVSACHKSDDALAATQLAAAAPIHVQTAAVTQRPIPELLTLTGTLRASAESDVAADVSGKVVQTFVERGQPVHAGQVIAIVDSRVAAFAATAAEAQAHVAQTQLEEARRDCERVKHLLDTGAISQADFDRQTSQCTAQQWSATAAEAQQQSATKLLGDTRIRAPFDGIIGERMINVGQYVEPSTRVASIYLADPLRLELTIPEADLASIHEGVDVSFSVAAFGDEKFAGTIRFISPNVREASRDLVAEAVVANPDGKLRPGMFAVAKLELGEKPSPVVALNALARDDTAARLFVVGTDNRVQERLVRLGETKGDLVAVLSGAKTGEAVVLAPGPDVRDGARVE